MADREFGRQSSGASQERDASPRDREIARSGPKGKALRLARLAHTVWLRFGRDGCRLMAAATAFYGLICLIPLVALAISLLGRVVGPSASGDPTQQILAFLQEILSLDTPGIEDAIRHFPQPSGSWFVEAISILGLLWAASRLFHTLEDILTRIWSGHGRGRPLFLRNLVALGATAAAGLIFLMTMLGTAAAATLASTGSLFGRIPVLHRIDPWVDEPIILLGAWLMFLLMYVFLPQERVRWRDAAIGAAAAALMWEVSRLVFGSLATHSAAYGRLYGSLAGTMVLVIWIYLTATIMLLGAELAVVLQQGEEAEEGRP